MITFARRTGVPRLGAAATLAIVALTGCSGGSPSSAPTGPAPSATSTLGGRQTTPPTAGGPVLPVTQNPIVNTSTVRTLKILSVLVENNVDARGKAVDDHLEVALQNTGTTALTDVEIYYTFTDPTTKDSESYYSKLPGSFTVPAGGTRTAHFDSTGAADHFGVNKFNLYYTSQNALDVTVEVSSPGAAVQQARVKKDAGGAEAPD